MYDELCLGIVKPILKQQYLDVIGRLVEAGAEAIILGCTEIALLIKEGDTDVPLFDTTYLYAVAAVTFALAKE